MTKEQYKKYLEAVDTVCIDCYFSDKPIICSLCPVRRSCDIFAKEMQKEA